MMTEVTTTLSSWDSDNNRKVHKRDSNFAL